MSENYSDSNDLNATENEEIFQEVSKSNSGAPFAHISAECFYEIKTIQELRAYGTICRYSGKSGVCFTSNEQLKKDYPSHDDSNFSHACKKLHENGFLYRYQISKHKNGSMRFLVPRCHWRKYHATLMRKNYLKEAARVEGYFEGVDPEVMLEIYVKIREAKKAKKAKSNPPENRPLGKIYQPDLDLVDPTNSNNINNINIIKKTNDVKESQNPPESQPPKSSDSLRSFVPTAFTDKRIFEELTKAGITGEKAAIALEYWQLEKSKIEKKDNPVGFLISASRKGWDADFVQEYKIKQQSKIKQTTTNETRSGESNCNGSHARGLEIEFNAFFESQCSKLSPEMINALYKATNFKAGDGVSYITVDGKSFTLTYTNPDFIEKIKLAKTRLYESFYKSMENKETV